MDTFSHFPYPWMYILIGFSNNELVEWTQFSSAFGTSLLSPTVMQDPRKYHSTLGGRLWLPERSSVLTKHSKVYDYEDSA